MSRIQLDWNYDKFLGFNIGQNVAVPLLDADLNGRTGAKHEHELSCTPEGTWMARQSIDSEKQHEVQREDRPPPETLFRQPQSI